MKRLNLVSVLLAFLLASHMAYADDDEESDGGNGSNSMSPKDLTKDEIDSCNANLCLGETGKDLVECEGPLKKLNDMKKKKRPDFLAICPK